jgi:hypothetical protein
VAKSFGEAAPSAADIGHGQGKPSSLGRMCNSCDLNQMALWHDVNGAPK